MRWRLEFSKKNRYILYRKFGDELAEVSSITDPLVSFRGDVSGLQFGQRQEGQKKHLYYTSGFVGKITKVSGSTQDSDMIDPFSFPSLASWPFGL